MTLLETKDLKKYYDVKNGKLHAVDGVSICVEEGETLGVVGESGCGKSTLGRVVLGLERPTSGDVLFQGKSIVSCGRAERKKLRPNMQIIFQDPLFSLDSRIQVLDLIAEPLLINKVYRTRSEANDRVKELMEMAGLSPRFASMYPNELDGGRRQRICVARALALNPRMIVCDEPVSALDVSIQAQILNLLMDLQESMHLTYVFITHNLAVVKHISTKIAVMYLGQCIELASSREIFEHPMHPYTQALLAAIPIPKLMEKRERTFIKGELSNPINPKPGCRFAPRCPHASQRCLQGDVTLKDTGGGHQVACWLYE
ncbi:ATP-binding cassette domain-containing protein [Oscillibacter sp. MSJ-2]|uniref:ATP-binding cassette domain-containing protein n=1 Tax=Dysosmobacter acutus TaxID=2841504 RepID=A0ABS6F5L1_9FIRM|nr:oligopeptide/dipeptide ABC transporter ATP-binding protein [Dysosmobacter acutus]MBU5625363.1 ATP-binding cassette domain-containing protein [Dysosmobacter acutus]